MVLRGNRVEEFDFESANRKQLRGNIYLAKVTRVEPSLQAAFVDYGGNRHGFLAFSEIHPDYYQIPVADRQALIAQEERDAARRRCRCRSPRQPARRGRNRHRQRGADRPRDAVQSEPLAGRRTAAREAAEIPAGEAALGGLPPEQPPRPNCRRQRRRLPISKRKPTLETSARGLRKSDRRYRDRCARRPPRAPAGEAAIDASADAGRRRRPWRDRRPSGRRRRAGAVRRAERARTARATATAKTTTKKKRWNPSAAPTRWRKCRSACRASAASTRFKR